MGTHCTVNATDGNATMNFNIGDAIALYSEDSEERAFYEIKGVTDTGLVRVTDVNSDTEETMGQAEFEREVDSAAIVTLVKGR